MKKTKKALKLDKLVISQLTNTYIIKGGVGSPGCHRPSCDNGKCPSKGGSQIFTVIDC